tara:strand:- start:250 stop:516 length:267 start_codon:yes stop_codon:yes gene_type:complete
LLWGLITILVDNSTICVSKQARPAVNKRKHQNNSSPTAASAFPHVALLPNSSFQENTDIFSEIPAGKFHTRVIIKITFVQWLGIIIDT